MNAIGDAVARGISFRNGQRWSGNIGREDFCVRHLVSERDSDAAGPGADIGNAELWRGCAGREIDLDAVRAQSFKRDFDDMLSLRARDQYVGCNLKFESPEFLFAGEILRWLAR